MVLNNATVPSTLIKEPGVFNCTVLCSNRMQPFKVCRPGSYELNMSTPSSVRQIQGASCIRTNVRPAVVRPTGGLWQREVPRTLHTQHSARLLLLLQVGLNIILTNSIPQYCNKQSSSFILFPQQYTRLTTLPHPTPKLPLDIIRTRSL